MERAILVPLMILLSIGATATDNIEGYNITYKERNNLTFDLDQKISGTGYFTSYKHILMPDALGIPGYLFNGVESEGKSHGSGIIKTDSRIYAESYYENEIYQNFEYDEEGEPYEDMEDADSIIDLKEDSRMVYSPMAMAIGLRYYAYHPVGFDSLLKDTACIKNRDGLDSINHIIEGAHGLDKALDIQANYYSTTMKVDENLTAGYAHIGILQLEGIPVDEANEESDIDGEIDVLGLALKDWKKPRIELKEDYVGTFHIFKNISLITDSVLVEKEEAWLPCCFNGWEDMLYYDQKSYGKSTKGIFDCTCSNVPIGRAYPKT